MIRRSSPKKSPADVLGLVVADRSPAGDRFQYSSTNYVLLGLILEHVRGRPLADVLRNGVLDISGVERLVYQPGETPTEPMAMPGGESTPALRRGRGYLPSLAGVTAAGPAGAMASDSPSLARWWRAFCGGEIVSQTSLTEMATFRDGYGLGLSDDTGVFFTPVVGHGGRHDGYVSYAGCLLEDGSVIVVLSNRADLDITEIADSLADAARSD